MNDRVGALYIRVSTNDRTELSPDGPEAYPAGLC